MKYYKVVRRHNKKLYSGNPEFAKSVRYMKDKWTFPPDNGNPFLFVFDSLDSAEYWSSPCICAIYECEIGKIIPMNGGSPRRVGIYGGSQRFTTNPCRAGIYVIDGYVPFGAVLTSKVKITKKIKEKQHENS
jgi:hypothetical protein